MTISTMIRQVTIAAWTCAGLVLMFGLPGQADAAPCDTAKVRAIEANIATTKARGAYSRNPQPRWILNLLAKYDRQLAALGCDGASDDGSSGDGNQGGSGTTGSCSNPAAKSIEASIVATKARGAYSRNPQPRWILNLLAKYERKLAALGCDGGSSDQGGGAGNGDVAMSCGLPKSAKTTTVNSGKALEQALKQASCGDKIVLAGGTYSGLFELAKNCTATSPIVVQGADYTARITSRLLMSGDNNVVTRVKFEGPEAGVVITGDNARVLRNKFTNWTGNALLLKSGKGSDVGFNEFYKPHAWGGASKFRHGILVAASEQAVHHKNAWIHGNYFHDFPAKPNPNDYRSGQSDAMAICNTGSAGASNFIIERNLIRRHLQGHGIVDIKCSKTTYRYNTIIDSPKGRVDIRGGNDSKIIGNWNENSGGSTIHGARHLLLGNMYKNTTLGITIAGGTQSWTGTGGQPTQSYKVEVIGNTSNKLIIGRQYAGYTFVTADTLVAGHKGSTPQLQTETGTKIAANAGRNVPAAVKLGPADVGVSAACVTGRPN